MEKIFIGMPVFNGEKFIYKAIESIINQTYQNWEMLISDNNSSDSTRSICESFVAKETRITYIKQDQNIGAGGNFQFLLESATAGYFMWAAADDLWDKDFIRKCFIPLLNDKDIALSFCNIKNIDSFGEVISEYHSFKRFVHDDKQAQITTFILDPENSGKANLIYGIYRLSFCKQFLQSFLKRGMDTWGADIALVLGVLLLPSRLFIEENCLFFKRIDTTAETSIFKKKIEAEFPNINGIPLYKEYYTPYYRLLNETAASSNHVALVKALTKFRIEFSNDLAGFKDKINIKGNMELQSLGIKNLLKRLGREISKKF